MCLFCCSLLNIYEIFNIVNHTLQMKYGQAEEVNKTKVTRCFCVLECLLSFRLQWQIELAHHSFVRPQNGPYILELTFITTEDGEDASVEWFTSINIYSLQHRLQSV